MNTQTITIDFPSDILLALNAMKPNLSTTSRLRWLFDFPCPNCGNG